MNARQRTAAIWMAGLLLVFVLVQIATPIRSKARPVDS